MRAASPRLHFIPQHDPSGTTSTHMNEKGADRTIAAGPQVHLASRLALVTPAPTHDSRGDNGNKSKRAQHGKGGVVGAVTGVGRCCRRLGSSRRDCGHLRGIVLHVARKLALLGLVHKQGLLDGVIAGRKGIPALLDLLGRPVELEVLGTSGRPARNGIEAALHAAGCWLPRLP